VKLFRSQRSASTGGSPTKRRCPRPVWMRTALVVAIACGVALIAALAPTRSLPASASHASASHGVRVKDYYLALGTSLAYGQQPPDFDHGYPQQWFQLLQADGSQSLTNYGCPGWTSTQMITTDNCSWVDPYDPSHPTLSSHDPYNDQTQLGAAVAFIRAHPHQVSPVSLDMGANELLPLFDVSTCSWNPSTLVAQEATLDANLRQTILPQLIEALKNPGGQLAGDLVVMNYYDPYANVCPNTIAPIQDFNAHIAADVAYVATEEHVNIPMADVFAAFGGAAYPNPNLCTYTWFCPQQGTFDPHATTQGYGVIAQTFNQLVASS
jgi:hypothetical protein